MMTGSARRTADRCPTAVKLSRHMRARSPAVIRALSPEEFGRIRTPGVELVIWERGLPAGLSDWLDTLHPGQCPDGRLLVAGQNCRAAYHSLLNRADTPAGPMRDAFLTDMVTLSDIFCRTMDTDYLDIRLETVTHDGCWKFHRDSVPARLLTTYRGPGTEWVLPENSEAALTQQKAFNGQIEMFPDQAVGLFKGSRAASGSGIVHRSPPIHGSGTIRILLCLNLPSAASPELWQG